MKLTVRTVSQTCVLQVAIDPPIKLHSQQQQALVPPQQYTKPTYQTDRPYRLPLPLKKSTNCITPSYDYYTPPPPPKNMTPTT